MIDPMREDYLEPARTVITILGDGNITAGIANASKAAGVHRSRVNRWLLAKDRTGTGGRVPTGNQQALLDWAKANGKPLEPEHFFSRLTRPKHSESVAA
jgi:hypothetical protein